MTRGERQDLLKGLMFISPWIIGFAVFTALPVYLSFQYSLSDYTLLQPPVYEGLSNYRDLAHDPVFWKTLENTLYYAAAALPLAMVISIGLALLLNAKIKGQSIYRTIIFLPSLVPMVASAILWQWIFNTRLGLINFSFAKIGINGPDWLGDARWVMPALILMSFWGVGNTVVIYLAGLQDVPRELYEAADIDGAGPWRRLWNVTLPMISPVIFFNLIMAIIGTLQVFGVPFVLFAGGSGPERSAYFYTMYLYDNAFVNLKMGYASAMAWIQLLIILGLTALAFWSSKRWVHYQGK